MNTLTLIIASCISGVCGNQSTMPASTLQLASIEQVQKEAEKQESSLPLFSGHYLSSRFAQNHHDWKNSYRFLSPIVQTHKDIEDLKGRAMILSMGAGEYKSALKLAKEIKATESGQDDILSHIFLLIEAFKSADYEEVSKQLEAMPPNPTTKFVGPFIQAWASAAQNKLDLDGLQDSTIKLYHGILISDYLNDHSEIKKTLEKALKVEDIQPGELLKIADIYGHIGMKEKSEELYETAKEALTKIGLGEAQIKHLDQKISDIKSGKNENIFEEIKSPQEGLAKAFYDIGNNLFSENNDETAQIFAHISLYIKPDLYDATLLLADIAAKYGQYQEALNFYSEIPQEHKDYIPSRHKMAEMWVEMDDNNKALSTLEQLAHKTEDIKTRIKIADIYRRNEQFGLALDSYNKAAKEFSHDVPDEYWHLYYLRGMTHEQAKNWTNAEDDLKKALTYRPDHPYLLNYLGYAWADRGENLDQALGMIKRAVDLRPNDGFIIDSLGWVQYRLGQYEDAIPNLERAVELQPYDPIINDHLGDAYWKVGRKLEAKFQWERSINHSKDNEAILITRKKLESGLQESHKIAEADAKTE
ncbi:MAG: tetratricopeptide repeat protein [Alphaproteobacteria bacterium]|nr:tetratricopeptide repeat protein [Alphaproteobacteria bacterium]